MKTGELNEMLRRISDADPKLGSVLITVGSGPYRSPGSVTPISGTDDTIIQADYPRAEIPDTPGELHHKLNSMPPDGDAQVYVPGTDSFSGYWGVTRVRLRPQSNSVVIVAEQFRTG